MKNDLHKLISVNLHCNSTYINKNQNDEPMS